MNERFKHEIHCGNEHVKLIVIKCCLICMSGVYVFFVVGCQFAYLRQRFFQFKIILNQIGLGKIVRKCQPVPVYADTVPGLDQF